MKTRPRRSSGRAAWTEAFVTVSLLASCTWIEPPAVRLSQTAVMIEEVKLFGKRLGIEPTAALVQTARDRQPLTMLWIWMQRAGTLALRHPVDIRAAIGFETESERLKVEQFYRVDGYSIYYRQGSEFADPRAVTTVAFTAEPLVRRVKVILHEDLHGDQNFSLPWELEEAIVTPLGSLAAVEYFRFTNDERNWRNAVRSLTDERRAARELVALAEEAERIFARQDVEAAKQKILAVLPKFPAYHRMFTRQINGQHAPTALEAKLSHDLAYYRYFDRIAALAEIAPSLKDLIDELKQIPADATPASVERFLRETESKYAAAGKH